MLAVRLGELQCSREETNSPAGPHADLLALAHQDHLHIFSLAMAVFSKISAAIAVPLLLAAPAMAGSIGDIEHVVLFMQGGTS
jgi:phospholipase C